MTNPIGTSSNKTYTRFDLLQRIEHLVFLISFSVLAVTGLPQKFLLSPISIRIFDLLGGIEVVRSIHHSSAIVMMIVSLVHILEVLYRVIVLRTPVSMIPRMNDIQHVVHDIMYYLGLRKHKAYYGRYSYAEKAEYLALILGSIVMGLTGFMLWNPLSTARFLTGESIPAAKAAHGSEAVLAVLAIIIWHFYHVHIKLLNKSMFTGKLTREEMKHEHPAELAAIEAAEPAEPVPPTVLRRRRMIYCPIAAVISAAFSIGFYYFVGYETTAVAVAPPAETAPVYVPASPAPAPIPSPASATESETVQNLTWTDSIGPILQTKCGACHQANSITGLSMDSYADLMNGGTDGPVVVPTDSDGSKIVTLLSAGGHPGTLDADELNALIEWIKAGAPE